MEVTLPSLDQIDPADTARFGGKAANLGRLSRAGFRVPSGFVVPAGVTDRLRGIEPSRWPEEVRDAVLRACDELCPDGGTVAVRSSATDEDSEAGSFAGQHETVLGVMRDGLLDAVARCLASLDSEAAKAYRARTGLEEAHMAVVVQRMVEGEASGVAFSVDPVDGNREHAVVEAVAGRGEGLVSGRQEATRLVFDRETLAAIDRHEAGKPPLDDEMARAVAREVLNVESALGAPQDIEFTVKDGKVWLLQARPVTASGAETPPSEFDTPTDDTTLWTAANVQEVLPGVLTPLTISTTVLTGYIAYTQDYHNLHLLDRDERPEFIGYFHNRAFLNVSAVRMIADRAIFTSADAIENRYFGGTKGALPREPWLRRWKYQIISAPLLLRSFIHFERDVDRMERQVLEAERRLQRLDLSAKPDAELEELRQKTVRFGARMFRTHLRITGAAGGMFEQVGAALQPVLGDEAEEVLPPLFSGMKDVESAQLTIGLWELSRVALQAGLAEQVKAPGFDPLDPALPSTWRDAYSAFLERHGHRGLNEMEAAARTWRQDPSQFLGIVASYVDLDESQSPVATLDRQKARRLELTADIESRMNPVRRALFRWQLGTAQRIVGLRERTKSVAVRAIRLGDLFMPEYQQRLVDRGILGEPGDVFFLTREELDDIFHGRVEADYHSRIVRRKAEMERNRHIELPERFFGRPAPLPPDLSAHEGEVLTGTPVSPGHVVGRARVIHDPAIDGGIEPGEVLVAPVTDAGWTPLFAMASGLVVDMGSALSHGSTVAREYGLPAVVNVRSGTRRIRTGDLVAVDGSKGTVAILEAAGSEVAPAAD